MERHPRSHGSSVGANRHDLRKRDGPRAEVPSGCARHPSAMYSAACVLTGDTSAAEDLVAAAYARALRGFSESGGYESFKVWMIRTLTGLHVPWPWRSGGGCGDRGAPITRPSVAAEPWPHWRSPPRSNGWMPPRAMTWGRRWRRFQRAFALPSGWQTARDSPTERSRRSWTCRPKTISSGLRIARTFLAGLLVGRIAPTVTPGTPRPQARADGLPASRGDPAW